MTIDYPPSFDRLKIHCKPNIPEKKINNALDTYVTEHIYLTDIILLVDETVFGSAKSGLLLTCDKFYYKKDFEKPVCGELQGISDITYKKGVITHSLFIEYNNQPNYWVLEFTQCSGKDISILAKYLLTVIRQLQQQAEVENVSKTIASEDQAELNVEDEQNTYESNQSIVSDSQPVALKIPTNISKPAIKTLEVRSKSIKSTPKQTPQYFGTMIGDSNQPEPTYFGRLQVPQEETPQPVSSEGNSLLTKFLQNNSDSIVAKLKTSGLALTSAALQNDDNIIRIAGIIYNILPTPIRFVVSRTTLEDLLLKNRHWLINKLQ